MDTGRNHWLCKNDLESRGRKGHFLPRITFGMNIIEIPTFRVKKNQIFNFRPRKKSFAITQN